MHQFILLHILFLRISLPNFGFCWWWCLHQLFLFSLHFFSMSRISSDCFLCCFYFHFHVLGSFIYFLDLFDFVFLYFFKGFFIFCLKAFIFFFILFSCISLWDLLIFFFKRLYHLYKIGFKVIFLCFNCFKTSWNSYNMRVGFLC